MKYRSNSTDDEGEEGMKSNKMKNESVGWRTCVRARQQCTCVRATWSLAAHRHRHITASQPTGAVLCMIVSPLRLE